MRIGGSLALELEEEETYLRIETQEHFLMSQVPTIPQLRGVLQSRTHLHVL